MKLQTSQFVYKRLGAGNNTTAITYLEPATEVELETVVTGTYIDGNNIWYKLADNTFMWSGGFNTVAFIMDEDIFSLLSKEEQYEIVSQAMDYYYDILKSKVVGFTGMSASFKKTGERYLESYALIVQVDQKSNNTEYIIPDHLPYNGFNIPTDVDEVSKTTFCSGLGDSISRDGSNTWGSAGFLCKRTDVIDHHIYLVTNYHVVCEDLLKLSPPKFSITINDVVASPVILLPAFLHQGKKPFIGMLVEGILDRFNDLALIKLESAGKAILKNSIPNGLGGFLQIKDIRTLKSLKKDFKPATISVRMYGATSKTQSLTPKSIISLNSPQDMHYLNGKVVQHIKELIAVEKISLKGDSGSALLDMEGGIIGLLVGDDSKFSYFLPIENILSNLKIEMI